MSLRYYRFGKKKPQYMIEFGIYNILLKPVKIKKRDKVRDEKGKVIETKQLSLTISDNKGNLVMVRGYPSILPPITDERQIDCNEKVSGGGSGQDYSKRRQKIADIVPEDIDTKGTWKIEEIYRKGYVPKEGFGGEFVGERASTLRKLLCLISPEDANDLGPRIEDFIRDKYYTKLYKKFEKKEAVKPEFTGSVSSKDIIGSVASTADDSAVSQKSKSDIVSSDLPSVIGSVPEVKPEKRPEALSGTDHKGKNMYIPEIFSDSLGKYVPEIEEDDGYMTDESSVPSDDTGIRLDNPDFATWGPRKRKRYESPQRAYDPEPLMRPTPRTRRTQPPRPKSKQPRSLPGPTLPPRPKPERRRSIARPTLPPRPKPERRRSITRPALPPRPVTRKRRGKAPERPPRGTVNQPSSLSRRRPRPVTSRPTGIMGQLEGFDRSRLKKAPERQRRRSPKTNLPVSRPTGIMGQIGEFDRSQLKKVSPRQRRRSSPRRMTGSMTNHPLLEQLAKRRAAVADDDEPWEFGRKKRRKSRKVRKKKRRSRRSKTKKKRRSQRLSKRRSRRQARRSKKR